MDTLDKIETTVKNDLSWVQKHERLLICTLVLVVVLVLGNKWLDKSAADAQSKAAVAQEILAEQKQANAALAAQAAKQEAEYQQMMNVLERQNQALVQAMASRDAASKQQIANVIKPKNATDALKDLNTAYQTALPATVTADDQLQFPVPVVQQFTVTKIEHDVLKADLVDETKIAENRKGELDKANMVITALGTRVDGLNLQIGDQDKACKAEVAEVKAKARKSKRNWFIAGFITGIATRILVKF